MLPRIPFCVPDTGEQEIAAVTACLKSGWIATGTQVADFETAFARFVGVDHAVAVNCATSGALLTLQALGIGPGDEVVVPVWTFSSPAMMAHLLGARIVFCDVDPGTLNMTPATLAPVLSGRTKVVMPTHFAGHACDTAELVALAAKVGAVVVDDAAHAFPSRGSDGALVGGENARATFFSFYATKPLTTGDGGMVVTNDADLATHIRRARANGFDRECHDRYMNPRSGWRYEVVAPGWMMAMNDIAASIGLAQLDRVRLMLDRRRRIAELYDAAFAELPVGRPEWRDGSSWHLYPLRVPCDRDRFVDCMLEQGVQCSVHFIPLHRHGFWRDIPGTGKFPNADAAFRQTVSLPIYSRMELAQAEQVVQAVRTALARIDGSA